MECSVFALVAGSLDGEDFAIYLCRDAGGELPFEFSLGAFNVYGATAVDGYFDLWWDRDGFFTDS